MATEAKTGLEWAPSGALQVDLIVNPILRRLAAVGGQPTVIDKDLATPPSHVAGAVYIVASSPTGAWVGHTDHIAYSDGTAWYFYAPSEGWEVYVLDEDTRYRHSGTTWVAVGSGGSTAPNVQSVVSSATVTPTFSNDMVKITAQAANLTLANPTGTAVPAWGITIRIKDNGTARTISYGTQYRAIGVTLPTTTVISKTLYLGMIYNSDDTKWDVVAVAQEA